MHVTEALAEVRAGLRTHLPHAAAKLANIARSLLGRSGDGGAPAIYPHSAALHRIGPASHGTHAELTREPSRALKPSLLHHTSFALPSHRAQPTPIPSPGVNSLFSYPPLPPCPSYPPSPPSSRLSHLAALALSSLIVVAWANRDPSLTSLAVCRSSSRPVYH